MKERVGLCPETYEGVPVGYRRRVSRRVVSQIRARARGGGVPSHSLLSRGRVLRVSACPPAPEQTVCRQWGLWVAPRGKLWAERARRCGARLCACAAGHLTKNSPVQTEAPSYLPRNHGRLKQQAVTNSWFGCGSKETNSKL